MAKKTILVNRQVIDRNKKQNQSAPPLSCKIRGKTQYGHEIIIRSSDGFEIAKLVYDPKRPRNCGATVWLETQFDVDIITRAMNSEE